ncbi:hypothetical protein F6Q72_00180 [Staphylococcus aureus]|nr:hypothetical protein [Staphylococcus aureus]MBG1154851.1 hypothetical protein [Staphylococcus aureus]
MFKQSKVYIIKLSFPHISIVNTPSLNYKYSYQRIKRVYLFNVHIEYAISILDFIFRKVSLSPPFII